MSVCLAAVGASRVAAMGRASRKVVACTRVVMAALAFVRRVATGM